MAYVPLIRGVRTGFSKNYRGSVTIVPDVPLNSHAARNSCVQQFLLQKPVAAYLPQRIYKCCFKKQSKKAKSNQFRTKYCLEETI